MSVIAVTAPAGIGGGSRRLWWAPPLLATSLAVLGLAVGWRGVDLPAQIYRVTLFHNEGFTLWDTGWYGGHWTLDYSVLFPPIGGMIGVGLTGVASAALAALAFDRLVIGHFGPTARVGSFAFALGTIVQLSIGQLPFLLGEALGLAACWAASRRRWGVALGLAIATSLASPLAGAFLGLAGLAWLISRWPAQRVGLGGLIAGAAVPVVILELLFPGQGFFPFPAADFVFEGIACGVMVLLLPRHERVLRAAGALYMLATTVSFFMPSAMGGNIGRLLECVAVPIAACVLWPLRRWALIALAVPIALWQWVPAWGAVSKGIARDPSSHKAYYDPLVSFLASHDQPQGRVEVVPTRFHWEAAYVAPAVPLARGWERQLDTANNPLFYDETPISAATYRAWLLNNGVRYVALPDAPIDFAGQAESALVASGAPGLTPVWHDAHWKVFEVIGSDGIADGPIRLVNLAGDHASLIADESGVGLLRVHFNPRWTVASGAACVRSTADGWTELHISAAGPIELRLTLVGGKPTAC